MWTPASVLWIQDRPCDDGVVSEPEAQGYDDGPVAALRRIAFLLERSRAETYKVKAFRGAAARVLATPSDELASRAEAGTLRDLEGIGKATEAVVLDALAGRVPAYLADLEVDAGPLESGGLALLRPLRCAAGAGVRVLRRGAPAGRRLLHGLRRAGRAPVARTKGRDRAVRRRGRLHEPGGAARP